MEPEFSSSKSEIFLSMDPEMHSLGRKEVHRAFLGNFYLQIIPNILYILCHTGGCGFVKESLIC